MHKTHQEGLFDKNPAAVSTVNPESFYIDKRNEKKILLREFRRLSRVQREILVLRLIRKRSYKEINAITGISTEKAASLVFDGLKHLAQKLQGPGTLCF